MEKLICTQCGAPINPETLKCDYCGSVFLSSKIETKNKKEPEIAVPKVSNAELNKLIKNHLNQVNSSLIFGIVFMVVWTGIALSMSGIVFKFSHSFHGYGFGGKPAIISIVPLFFAFIGITSIISNFSKLPLFKWKDVYKLIDAGKYEEAYEKLTIKEQKKHNACNLYAQILIGYYRLNKFDEVRNLIIAMPAPELNLMLKQDIRILNIANSLNIKTPDFIEFEDVSFYK